MGYRDATAVSIVARFIEHLLLKAAAARWLRQFIFWEELRR
jgi:hypothetical protein